MQLSYCEGCGYLVPDEEIQAGSAVYTDDGNKIYCAKCVTAGVVQKPVVAAAKLGAQQGTYRTGGFAPVARTGNHAPVAKTGSHRPVSRRTTKSALPRIPGTLEDPVEENAPEAAPSTGKKKSLLPILIFGAPVVICIGVMVMVMTAEKTGPVPPQKAAANPEPEPSANTESVKKDEPLPNSNVPVMKRGMLGDVVSNDPNKPANNILEETAVGLLKEAMDFKQERPDDLRGYRDRLRIITDRYRSTNAGMEAWKALGELPSALINEPTTSHIEPTLANIKIQGISDDREWTDVPNLVPQEGTPGIVHGTWQNLKGVLVSDTTKNARLEFPATLPEEYDFRIVFSRLHGKEDVAQMSPLGGTMMTYVMEGYGGGVWCFGKVGSTKPNSGNPASINAKVIENSKKYSSTLRVRKNGVRAYINGRFNNQWKPEMGPITEWESWALKNKNAVGIGSYQSNVAFFSVQVRPYKPGEGLWTSFWKRDKARFTGMLFAEPRTRLNYFFGDNPIGPGMPNNDFGMIAAGFLRVPAAGTYSFRLWGDDQLTLTLDGKEAAKFSLAEKKPHKEVSIELTAGDHPIRLEHLEGWGDAGFILKWKTPGAADFTEIPITATGHDPAQIEEYQKP